MHNRSSFVNHTQLQIRMSKIYTRSQINTEQKPYPLEWYYLYGLNKGVSHGPLLYTLSAAFPPFILRIRNYRSETTKSTTNVTNKILNQKVLRTCVGFSDEKEVATIVIGHLYEEVFLL